MRVMSLSNLLLTLSIIASFSDGHVVSDVRLAVLIPWTGNWPAGPRLASAVIVAIDAVEELGILPDHNITYVYRDSMCQTGPALNAMSDLRLEQPSVDAFIGPACSVGCTAGGHLSAHWNLPMISYGCLTADLTNKDLYPTTTRTVGPLVQSGKFILRVTSYFKWKRIAIITSTEQIWSQISSFVKQEFDSSEDSEVSYFQTFSPGLTTNHHFKAILQSALAEAHVFIFVAYGSSIRKIMLNVHDLGMLSSKYAFFSFEVLPESCKGDDGRDAEACAAFEGLMDIGVYIPEDTPRYQSFENAVRNRMPEFAGLGYKMPASAKVDVYAGFLHDAVLLYALALNSTLAAGGNITDGRTVARHMMNRSFVGVTGEVFIDENGDRTVAFQLRNHQNRSLVKIANYFRVTDTLEILNNTIVWPGGGTNPPLGRPECGFDNELCTPAEIWKTIVYVLVPVMVLILIFMSFAFFLRKRSFEAALHNDMWKIKAEDVQFTKKVLGGSFQSKRSMLSSNGDLASNFSNVLTDEQRKEQIFTTVAFYKSTLVAVKKLRKTHVYLDRTVLLELKEVRDIQHPNINPFIGACVDTPNIWILTQYCNKGSLQDVLNNDSLKLDWMFQISFASDIARGMLYLHKSPISVHGNLKSSNCVIDSRWVCKISDFGLRKFKDGQAPDMELGFDFLYNQLLWCAPENLTDPERPGKSQPGDVFSYGIILQEILLRGLPYCTEQFMEAKAIVSRVRQGEVPPFRPNVYAETSNPSNIAYIHLMQECWEESPALRPNFFSILRRLKKINKGRDVNIMDNMIAMMERYTDHLEDLVRERTHQLEEEKLRTDALLYRMLPRTVAEQLKQGQPITAESFDSVTIFFSDIVSFTTLASESTPLEVVNLLNDLYTCFDKIIDSHDVYKVETIGDSYMVVSGLPERNGVRHAGEIANMSLDLLSDMSTFTIRHRPGQQLQLRIGMHSGACVAGVVGLKMPRYCLFGDTVNMASRMESSGLALRIHLSGESKLLLDSIGGYYIEERGLITMKGKGSVVSYFLNGRDSFTKKLPDLSRAATLEEHTFK
ncbi:atrial natriuretic peptide receptor 1 isoform X2 [Nematostella vectensis]|uniref:atrial natriuretic peptide receptor 1 isoform X2 n=1 Tax=Nematostella vectensis TaxID=45351 RepID=UPI002076F0EB|nr:atrial natriuretic peptide receptor 1 isoform X2 [Nematostella vectensis]